MSHDVIKLDYDLAEEMIRVFKDGAEQLQDTMQEMQSVASTLEGGALLGQAGDAFAEAIKDRLCRSINRLGDKFQEMAGDVQAAMQYMREAEAEAKSKF